MIALFLMAREAERPRRCERGDPRIGVTAGTPIVCAAIVSFACGWMAAGTIARRRVMVRMAVIA
jgi:hypothetical protein